MKQASTVEEVLSKIFTYNWGDSIDYQIHFADKSGDAAVIHPGTNGELTYTRKSKGNGYLISTNFNLAKLGKGNWSSSYSSERYKTADKMLSKIGTQNDLTIEFMASVLNTTHQNSDSQTLYSIVYDLQNLRINLYYDRQFDSPYMLDHYCPDNNSIISYRYIKWPISECNFVKKHYDPFTKFFVSLLRRRELRNQIILTAYPHHAAYNADWFERSPAVVFLRRD
jgi:hypothetical protein